MYYYYNMVNETELWNW